MIVPDYISNENELVDRDEFDGREYDWNNWDNFHPHACQIFNRLHTEVEKQYLKHYPFLSDNSGKSVNAYLSAGLNEDMNITQLSLSTGITQSKEDLRHDLSFHFLNQITNLEHLKCINIYIDSPVNLDLNYGLENFESLERIQFIRRFPFSGKCTIDISGLKETSNLRFLEFRNIPLDFLDLSVMKVCRKVEVLLIVNSLLDNITLAPLEEHPRLSHFRLTRTNISNLDLKPLGTCPNLQNLMISGHPFTYLDLSPLSGCKRLELIRISNTNLKSLDLSPLSQIRSLNTLDLNSNSIESINLSVLSDLPSLLHIYVDSNTLPSYTSNELLKIQEKTNRLDYLFAPQRN